ncbi:hypothetical protein PanWU01x14_365220 [Parasponia andersonii]|uniref:Transmembrane protein n=1 Tax=Parasponia andersonii TaxID=3476 RepID=A0A2P5A643_PARAD|nr:hypothetical protein PanWU01x14_365220 [Parasponia andersonii]
MSTKSLSLFLLFIVLLLSPPVFAIRPLTESSTTPPADYTLLRPKEGNYGKHGGFGSRPEVESCLPKGFRRTSAPSRYVNYQTLGSNLCNSSPTSSKSLNKP